MKTIGYFNEFNIISTTYFMRMGSIEKVPEDTILIDEETKTILINPASEKKFITELKYHKKEIEALLHCGVSNKIDTAKHLR